jgi:hypothetical protein
VAVDALPGLTIMAVALSVVERTMSQIATLLAIAALALAVAPVRAHPHPGDVVTDTLRGRVTEIDLERRTIAVDTLDRKTKKPRNYLMFLDKKVKVTQGKKKMAITELTPGQPVICLVEVELNERGEDTKFIAFEIRFDLQARPAVY